MAEAEANRFSVAVDDLGSGLWSGRVKQELEARTPLRNVLFSPSPSRPAVSVEEVPIRFLDARNDAQLARLRQLSHSPAAWFRSPFVMVVLVSCVDYEDYKRDMRLRLRAMADTEAVAPGQPELLFVYMRPAAVEAAAKGPSRAFDAMRKDLNKARRERCVRLDPLPPASLQPGAPAILGLEEFDRQARDALRAAFEARAAAYSEEVRRLMLNRLDPSWSFSTLFLVKDGLAAMLESAGLLEDALREYSELEACYLEVLQSGQQPRQPFGGKPSGEDESALLWSSWAATRQAASQPELPPEFLMRQALFASQSRLLLKLHRHAEVAERGLKFVRAFGALLAQQRRSGGVPPQLPEAWTFASYLSVAEATSRLQAARAEEKRKTDHGARGGGRRGRLSEAAPGTPHSSPPPRSSLEGESAAQQTTPSPTGASFSPAVSVGGHTRLQVKVAASVCPAASLEPDSGASPVWQTSSDSSTQMDWQLGVLPSAPAKMAAPGTGDAALAAVRGTPGSSGMAAAPGSAGLYLLLAKLYVAARTELLRLGADAGLAVPDCVASARLGAETPQQAAAAAGAEAAIAAVADVAATAPPASSPPSGSSSRASTNRTSPLPHAPSTTDLSQVDLHASSSNASEQYQQQLQEQAPASLSAGESQGSAPVTLLSAPDVQLDPTVDAEQQQQQQQSPAGAAPSQVPRLTVRPKLAGGEGDTPSSSPRSTSTHQSALTPTKVAEGRVVPPFAAPAATTAGPPSAPTSSRSEANDMRSVERQVVSALAERASRTAGGHVLAPKAPLSPLAGTSSAGLPPWLVHWRLRAALSSQQLFTELFVALSEAAARCYSQCGHLRNAALLRADVADALVKAGNLQRGAELYEAQCRTFLREGWHALAANALPKLAACQVACGSPGLAHTAAALLSLPAPYRGTPAERLAAGQLLIRAAQSAEGLAGCRPLLPPGPAATALQPEGAVILSAALFAAPPRAAVSRFFSRTGAGGAPLLAPPPGSAGGGALSAVVGDALAVQLEVDNQLPLALSLGDVGLVLAVLQEMTVIHSPRASPSPVAVLGSAQRQGRAGTPGTSRADNPFSYGFDAQDVGASEERYESQWQQVEELYCPLVAVSPAGGVPGSGSGDIDTGSSGPRLRPLIGEAALPPGRSVLTFLAAPLKRGLYKAVHLRARLHQLTLHVAVQPPQPLWQQHSASLGSSSGRISTAGSRRSSRAGTGGGSPLAPEPPGSTHSAEAIVMQVEQAKPRVQLELLAAGGSLIAGQEQWLGLALALERDALHSALLELTWPMGHPGSGGLGLPPLSRKPTGLIPRHRTVQSTGGDIWLSSTSSSALQASLATPPFIRPEHRAAALVLVGAAAGEEGGGVPAAQLLPAEPPAGPSAAWLLADGLQQQLSLPLVEAGQPVCLWWRVLAGEVAAAPEQVHIAPPAPRQSSRQLDARWLGVPGDQAPLPAAVLDVAASLEYASGCQRSHSRVLSAALRQPFAVTSVARELPSGGVAVQCILTSNMAVQAELSKLALEPQPGFSLTTSLLDSMGMLPFSLPPFGSVTASFLLAADELTEDFTAVPAKLQPSALIVEYSIVSAQQCGIAAASLAFGGGSTSAADISAVGRARAASGAAGSAASGAAEAAADVAAVLSVLQTPAQEVLDQLDASGRQRPSSPLGSPGKRLSEGSPTATAAAAALGDEGLGGPSGRQHCNFRHLLTLEMPASEESSSGALVYVRQLGPFVATLGQPTTLCWRLERSGTAEQQQHATRVAFEVIAESDAWQPVGRRLGGVTLAGHNGAVATIEATWVPLAAGTLPVPTLRLQDVNFQEVFDVGLSLSGTNAITVVEAY